MLCRMWPDHLMEALEKAAQEIIIVEVRISVMDDAGKYSENGSILTPWEAIIVSGVKK